MKKSDLSPTQRENRRLFVETLVATGWDPRGWEALFESNAAVTPDATLELPSDEYFVRIGLDLADGSMSIERKRHDDKGRIEVFHFFPQDDADIDPTVLRLLLRVVTTIQEDFKKKPGAVLFLVEKMVPVCDRVYMETPDEMIQVVPDRGETKKRAAAPAKRASATNGATGARRASSAGKKDATRGRGRP